MQATRPAPLAPVVKVKPRDGELQIDQGPILTARRLSLQASGPEEKAFAHDALRLADHEVDLAFADALREAASATPPATPEVRELLAAQNRH